MRVCPVFDDVNVLVVGDVMLDRFWSGHTGRVSPEAPVPVVKINQDDCRAGGAGNVAVNIAALGANVTLSGICGDDEPARQLRQAVELSGVKWAVCPSASETILKLRVLSRNQQLLRMDFEQDLKAYADDLFTALVGTQLEAVDTVVFSDYAKGTLQHVASMIALARERGKRVLVDPKGSDLERYRGATLLTPNLSEFEAVVGHCESEEQLLQRGEALRESLSLEALLITRSEKGMTLIEADKPPMTLPARAREVYDVTGAGDTVISTLAAALSAGESLAAATALANAAAGLVVAKLGTAVVTRDELNNALRDDTEALMPHLGEVVSTDALLARVAQAKAAGEVLVMTNGCFDLLHRGHIEYLARARAMGDRLIVAINSDASVARLKGPKRPINNLEARSAVLASLRSVDWVVAFDTDTPAELIDAVGPDILVKGGDYQPEEIAGAASVIARGGKVRIIDFVEGFSTTNIIAGLSEQSGD